MSKKEFLTVMAIAFASSFTTTMLIHIFGLLVTIFIGLAFLAGLAGLVGILLYKGKL